MTSVSSGGLCVAAWLAVAGLGTGIAMATAMFAALVELSGDKSGVGSAVLQAVNKTEGPLGIAILGSVLSAGYLARLHPSGLPAAAAATVRQSVFGGVVVAQKIHSASLLASVQAAFVHGMDMALVVSAGIAVAGVVLTLVFLPASNAPTKTMQQAWIKMARLLKRCQQSPVRLRERTMAKTPGGDSSLLRPSRDRAAGPVWRKNDGSISPPKSWLR